MKQLHFPWHLKEHIVLIGFCLLAVVSVITPVTAEGQIYSHISELAPDQYTPNQSHVNSTVQIHSLKSSASTSSVDYSLYVGHYLPMWATYTEGGVLVPGVTLVFQRSDDGINWCTIQSVVSGPDGYAWLKDYTESCSGLVYYRVIGSSPSLVQWLQTNPPTVCVPIPKCVQKTYSITCIENYDHMDRVPDSLKECNNFATALNNAGYQQNFVDFDDSVIPEDFGTDPTYSGHKITDSAFHYHSGHGTDALYLGLWTYLNLKNYQETWIVPPPPAPPLPVPIPSSGYVDAAMVENKWGGNLKWVMLDSCRTLKDANWHKALTTAHGILGFSGESGVNLTFPETFMNYAFNKDNTIVDAYKHATIDTYHDDNTTATVITKTDDQYFEDHFPGTGSMASDGDPNSIDFKIRHWNCRSGIIW